MDLSRFVEDGLRALGKHGRFDAGEVANFSRSLEYIFAQTYDVQYPDLMARTLIPVNTEVDPGAEQATYSQYNEFGEARIAHDMADDGANAEVQGLQFTTPIVSLTSSYRYSLQDLRKASMAKVNLDGKKAMAARNAIMRKMETICATGDTATLLKGLTNATGIIPVTVTTKTTANTWSGANGGAGATAADVMADINALQNAIFTTTKGIWTPDTLVLGTKGYTYIATKPQSPTFTEKSILDYVLAASPWIKNIFHWAKVDTAGESSTTERIMCYARNPQVLEQIIPQDFEQLPPQARAYSFIINCHARHAGVQVRYPKAIAYMDATQVA